MPPRAVGFGDRRRWRRPGRSVVCGQAVLPLDRVDVPSVLGGSLAPVASAASVPFSGRSPRSRHHSHGAAEAVRAKEGSRAARYLDALADRGPISDHRAAEFLKMPPSTINGLRNRAYIRPLVTEDDRDDVSPNGKPRSRWKLRDPDAWRLTRAFKECA